MECRQPEEVLHLKLNVIRSGCEAISRPRPHLSFFCFFSLFKFFKDRTLFLTKGTPHRKSNRSEHYKLPLLAIADAGKSNLGIKPILSPVVVPLILLTIRYFHSIELHNFIFPSRKKGATTALSIINFLFTFEGYFPTMRMQLIKPAESIR
jgi:hypothetical protein